VAFSPDGKRLACTYSPDDDDLIKDSVRSIRIWDLATRQAVVTIDRLPNLMVASSFSPDGKLLAGVATLQGLVKVWDAATGREAFSCRCPDGYRLLHVYFSPDGKHLAACGEKGIVIWDVARHETPVAWPSDSPVGVGLAFSASEKRLAMGGIEGIVELWDTAGGQKVQTFKGHSGPVETLAFSPDGTRLATGGADGTLRLWDATARRDSISVPKDGLSPGGLPELSPDGQTLLTWGTRRPLRLWDTATGEPRCGPIELQQAVLGQAWTADGRHLYVADAGKTMRVVDVATGKVVRTFPIDAEPNRHNIYLSIALNADERWCAHPEPGGTIQVRDARTGGLFRAIRDLDGYPVVLKFSPDGSRLLGAGKDREIKIWDIASGREIAATACTGVMVWEAQFSADGKRLAVAGLIRPSWTGWVRILDAENAREVWSLKGHTTEVLDVAFSPDGHRLATACPGDRTVRLWDLTTGQEILKLVDSVGVYSVRFVSDGRRLIGATHDRRIRVWDATPLPE
jgi:WD40 repeat protein